MGNAVPRFANAEKRDEEFLALLGKHELQIAACIHALVPSWHDAEDILQETKLQLWREFDKFQPGSNFTAWACTVARYIIRSHIKQKQRKLVLLSDDFCEFILARVAKTPEETDRRLELLTDCIKKLSSDALYLLQCCYVDRVKIKDIAVQLGRSLTGTYAAISRTRRNLFECMRKHLRREDIV
jgi:RNA polymerase sigma-70 factor (ECF subfamily)